MASEQLLAQLRFEEGLRLEAYQDSRDIKSIGYGHNLVTQPFFAGVRIPDRISTDLAEQVLLNDVLVTAYTLLQSWPLLANLDLPRRDACIQMAFQLGVHGFLGFSQLRIALGQQDWDKAYAEVLDSQAARECTNRWHRIAGQILHGVYYQVPALAKADIEHS
ncbi:hypothetical protein KEF85_05940 [Methylomonas paludis]|uniref:Lysozyme n=1 Tax=Methylomonas paludis TaxID=1173101 RepID=A0A975MQD7_9GAMM|nr:hypothetical protein [Methylomonas paludis]QWF71995.1 hypothetical protein KEF85_05940 [Methylomonas paludis]